MNKVKFIIGSLLLCISLVHTSPCHAQTDSVFKFQKLIPGTYSYLTVDNLNNVYVINETNQLKKIYANGDSASVFNDVKQLGNPSYIDVSNPLKILLYYNKYATTVVLDRFLNVRNTLNFRKQNIFLVNSIGTSYDNNIWLFDEQNFSLKKIDDEGKVIQESVDWRLLFDTIPTPNKLMDRNSFVYLYDSTKGFFVFDYYGSLKTKLPFITWHNIEISGDFIFGFNENKLYSYHLKTSELKEYLLPSFIKDYISIEAMNGKLYILKKEGVEIYSIQE